MSGQSRAGMGGVVIFDGICNFCVGSVNFILRHEAHAVLRFASIQTGTGARMARALGVDPGDARTFVLVERGRAWTGSDAAIRVARHLRWPWRALAVVWVIPRPIRDWVYARVAMNRRRWFGRRQTCMVPTPELMHRFVQDQAS